MTIYKCDLTYFSKLSPTLKGGDTVLLASGTYKDYKLTINVNGTATSRIVIKPEVDGQLIFTGQSTLAITGTYTTVANFVYKSGSINKAIKIQGSYNRLTGFDISYSGLDLEYQVGIDGLANRVDHCKFHDWSNLGVWCVVIRSTAVENFAIIDHNIFQNRAATSATNGLECIRIGDSAQSLSSSKSVITQNWIDNCNGEIECISNKSCDNIYYKNTYTNSEGTLTLRHGNRCYAYKNKFLQQRKPNSGGIRITGESHIVARNLLKDINGNGTTRCGIAVNNGMPNTPINGYYTAKNVKIIDNLLINNSQDFAVGVEVKTGNLLLPENLIITNNTVYKTGSDVVFSQDPSVKGATTFTACNNKCYASTMGRNPFNTGFTQYASSQYVQSFGDSYYGYDEAVGPQWNADVLSSELTVTPQIYYANLKKLIDNELGSTVTPTPTPTPSNITPSNTTPSNIVITVPNQSIPGNGSGTTLPKASAKTLTEGDVTLNLESYNDSTPGTVTFKLVNNNANVTKLKYHKMQFAIKGYKTDLSYPNPGTNTQASKGTNAIAIKYNGQPQTVAIWTDATKYVTGGYVVEFTLPTGDFTKDATIQLSLTSSTKETSILSLLSVNDASGNVSTFYKNNVHYQLYDVPGHVYYQPYYLPKPTYKITTGIDIGGTPSNIVITPSNTTPSNIIITPSNTTPSNIVIGPSNIITHSNRVISTSNFTTASNVIGNNLITYYTTAFVTYNVDYVYTNNALTSSNVTLSNFYTTMTSNILPLYTTTPSNTTPSNIITNPSNIVITPSNIKPTPSNTTPSNYDPTQTTDKYDSSATTPKNPPIDWGTTTKTPIPTPSNIPSDTPIYDFGDAGAPPTKFEGIGSPFTIGGSDNNLMYLIIAGIIVAVVTKNIS